MAGLLAGVALAPVLWIAVAWASGSLPRLVEGEVSFASVASAAVLCLAGFAAAYVAAARISPLAAGASGALLTALALWPAVHPASMGSALSWLNDESSLYPGGPGTGTALLLGALLLFSAAVPSRWRTAVPAAPAAAPEVFGVPEDTEPPAPVPDTVPQPPEVPPTVVVDPSSAGDPNKTTTPFVRDESGTVWAPLNPDAGGETR
nr:YIP1 family protein [Nocardiopsis algeriensis]